MIVSLIIFSDLGFHIKFRLLGFVSQPNLLNRDVLPRDFP